MEGIGAGHVHNYPTQVLLFNVMLMEYAKQEGSLFRIINGVSQVRRLLLFGQLCIILDEIPSGPFCQDEEFAQYSTPCY
ncbi:MAG: hypothetical protein LVR00_03445 [Rhabdochlamydiaceae bacterium]